MSRFCITILGSGTSYGVPTLDCAISNYSHCPKKVCRDALNDSKHKRGRSSILVEYNDKAVLIDCSPDFREQALREKIKHIDAVLFTHRHMDHIGGIPDLRSYSHGVAHGLPVYASGETIEAISETFRYIFDPETFVGGGIPSIQRHIIHSPNTLFEETFIPIPVIHGNCLGCFGYRFGNIAYIPDVKEIPEESLALLKDLDLLIIDCLRMEKSHSTHFTYPEIMELYKKIQPKRILGTHLCHDIHYLEDQKAVCPQMTFAYDGLKLEMP